MRKSQIKKLIKEAVGDKSKMSTDKKGNKFWELPNGQFHRTDGPAVELANGYRAWFLNGLKHRTDGPAIIYSLGNKSWFLNGKEYSEEEFNTKQGSN
jgi:hypothetical protein